MGRRTRWMVILEVIMMVLAAAMVAGCERGESPSTSPNQSTQDLTQMAGDEPAAPSSPSAKQASSADAGSEDGGHRAKADARQPDLSAFKPSPEHLDLSRAGEPLESHIPVPSQPVENDRVPSPERGFGTRRSSTSDEPAVGAIGVPEQDAAEGPDAR